MSAHGRPGVADAAMRAGAAPTHFAVPADRNDAYLTLRAWQEEREAVRKFVREQFDGDYQRAIDVLNDIAGDS